MNTRPAVSAIWDCISERGYASVTEKLNMPTEIYLKNVNNGLYFFSKPLLPFGNTNPYQAKENEKIISLMRIFPWNEKKLIEFYLP